MSLVPKTKTILIFIFLIVVYGLLTMDYGLIYAQNAKLKVPADVTTQTLILDPQGSAPASVNEGQLYYDDTANQVKYYDGNLPWKTLGGVGADTTVATKIVAASNSQGTTGCPGACTNPRADVGYVCDGTDDQVEIQNAINALGTTGGAVYLLEGTYNLSAAEGIKMSSGVSLIGAGSATILKEVGGDLFVIKASSVNNILISNLVIDTNYSVGYASIYFTSVTYSKIDKVEVKNTPNTSETWGAISFYGSSSYNSISNCYIHNNLGNGIAFEVASNNIIANNYVQSNGRNGILFQKPTTSNNVITNNIITSNTLPGIYFYDIYNPGNGPINNIICGNDVSGTTADYPNIWIRAGYYNIIVNNNVQSAGNTGIRIDSAAPYCTISGNNIHENKGWGMEISSNNNVISGNTVFDNGKTYTGWSGIVISGSNNQISSNHISDTAGTSYGICLSGASNTNNYLVGNLITGVFAAPIYDAGTSTKYTDKTKLTFEPGSGYTGLVADGTLTPSGPTSYLRLNPAASITLNTTTAVADGKSAGDLLILENINSSFTVTLNDNTNVQLQSGSSITLAQNDILTLLWNGTDWIEIGYANN